MTHELKSINCTVRRHKAKWQMYVASLSLRIYCQHCKLHVFLVSHKHTRLHCVFLIRTPCSIVLGFRSFVKKKYCCRLVYSRNTIIVLLIMARPWTGQPTNRNSIPNRGRWFSLLRSFETISGAHQGNGRRFTRRYRNRSVKLTITAKECRV